MVQWLRCYVSTAWGTGLTPAQGAKILCVKNIEAVGGGERKLPNNVLKTRAYDLEAQKGFIH